jgi:hypothetical protein
MTIPPIKVGQVVTAAWLNRHTEAINRMQGLGADGAPGGGMRVGVPRKMTFVGAVVARDIPAGAGPFKLHQMSYSVSCPALKNDGPITVDWTRRIVDVPSVLNGPDADPAMLYYPAPVIGTSEQTLTPWRGYCEITVIHGTGEPDAAPVWFADMWGENPAWGCPE